MDICSGAENTIHTEQMENIARFPWFFRIKMQLSHLYRNAAEEKNLCAQFMILFAQNYYKGRNIMTQKERMEKGIIYDPGASKIADEQVVYMERLGEFKINQKESLH